MTQNLSGHHSVILALKYIEICLSIHIGEQLNRRLKYLIAAISVLAKINGLVDNDLSEMNLEKPWKLLK